MVRSLTNAFRLARRDLRGGLAAFRGVGMALALAAATLAGIATVTQGLGGALRGVAEDSIGGDLSYRLFHRPATAHEHAVLTQAAGADGRLSETVELRAMVRAGAPAAERPPGDTAPVSAAGRLPVLAELKGVDDAYPLYGRLALRPDLPATAALTRQSGHWGAAVAPELLRDLGLSLGDRLRIGAIEVEIRAALVQEPDAALRAFALGPRVLLARAALAETGLLAPASPAYHYYRLRLPDAAAVAAARAAIAAALPDPDWRGVAAADGVPGAERVLEIAALLITVAGLAAGLIAAAAAAAAIRFHLLERRRRLAVLRTLGAGRLELVGLLLLQVLAALLLGAAPGALFGTLIGWGAVPMLSLWLGLEPLVPAPATLVAPFLLALASLALLVLLFAIAPLARAVRRPPATALRDRPDGDAPSIGWEGWGAGLLVLGLLAALIARTIPLPLLALGLTVATALLTGLFLLLGDLVRRLLPPLARRLRGPTRVGVAALAGPDAPTRTVIACFGLTLALLLALSLIADAARHQLRSALPATAPDLVGLHLPADQVERFQERLAAWAAPRGLSVEARLLPFLHGRLVARNGVPLAESDAPAAIRWAVRGDRGLSWSADPPEPARLVAGAWWPPDHAGPPQVALDAAVARQLGLGLGDRLTVAVLDRRIDAEIVALRDLDWTRLDLDVPLILSPDAVAGLPYGLLAGLWLEMAGEGTRAEAVTALRRALAAAVPDLPVIATAPALDRLAGLVDALIAVARTVGLLLALLALAVLAAGLRTGRQGRLREAAVLRAVGASGRDLAKAGLIESLILVGATLALAVPAGLLGAWLLVDGALGITWQPRLAPVLLVVGPGALIGLLAGLGGLRLVLQTPPAHSLRAP